MNDYRITSLVGRNRTATDGQGTRNHAVPTDGGWFAAALCGAKPAKRSNGWSDYTANAVTCPKCLAKLAKMEAK